MSAEKIWSRTELSLAKTPRHDGLCSREDTFGTVSCNETAVYVNKWVEQCSPVEKQLLRTLTGELTSDQLAKELKVDISTIYKRTKRFRDKAQRELEEIAP